MHIKGNEEKNLKELEEYKKKNKGRGFIRIIRRVFYDRASTIPSCFVGLVVAVHKGHKRRRLLIHKYNVGYKFGEFSFTRKPFFFPFRKKKGKRCRR
jgi:ribosomal protein S19